MAASSPILHLLCGKIASGKSTLAANLARAQGTVLISEDDWLSALFADQLTTGADYLRCSLKLQKVMNPHVSSLLQAGVSVVLDFAANTVSQREWMRKVITKTEVDHQFHVLDVPDEVCLARLRQRNARGEHAFAVTDAQFKQFTKHFEPPHPDEGFNVVTHPVAE